MIAIQDWDIRVGMSFSHSQLPRLNDEAPFGNERKKVRNRHGKLKKIGSSLFPVVS